MVLSALALLWSFVLPVALIIDLAIVLLVLFDALTLPHKSKIIIERKSPTNLSVGAKNSFGLRVLNRTRRAIKVEVFDSFPSSMVVEGFPAKEWIKARRGCLFRYHVRPTRRGAYQAMRTFLRIDSLLGFWKKQIVRQIDHPMKVLPDVKILSTYALLAKRNRIDLLGFRLARGRGSDVEFDRLREYQRDDDYRRIDPLASARARKLITREYQVSRNQNIVFLIDCGRSMGGLSQGLSTLDHALNASLMLSHVSLEQGDNIGLIAFDHQVKKVLPLSSGIRSKNAMLYSLYDLEVSRTETEYEEAFYMLQKKIRQRSLVVLMTNVMDKASFALLEPHLRALTKRHLPLVILLRDEDLFELADKQPKDVSEFYKVGAAAELALWREELSRQIQKLGVMTLDIRPSEATPELINTYLRIKAHQLL